MAKYHPILGSIDTSNPLLLWKPELNDGLGNMGSGDGECDLYMYCRLLNHKKNWKPYDGT